MAASSPAPPRSTLYEELLRFIRLRWIAGGAVLGGALLDGLWMHWFPQWKVLGAVGVLILSYNLGLRLALKPRLLGHRRTLLMLAWVQLLCDLACLTLLVVLTGGLHSPLATFYVFHMVFSSLLLPTTMAYGGAFAALAMLAGGVYLQGRLPQDGLLLAGQAVSLGLTVFLANRIVGSLRRQSRRLRRQNRKIRRIGRRLRRHQRTMIQHEKMIAMGQMAAGVTHEIANPLASMDSLLQLAQRRPERLTQATVSTLREQVHRVLEIVRQIKSFAYPRDIERSVGSPNEVVEKAIEMVRFDRRAGRALLKAELSPEVGQILFLPQALHQVLVNLLINALDAVAEVPSPVVSVQTERRGDEVVIEVSDNGTGIAPQHLRRLFEPFFTTKPLGKGTGLGLSISYSMIQRQGGTITARSTVGQGATFIIRLPAAGAENPDAAKPGAGGGAGEAAAFPTPGEARG